jgi:membrane protein YqaA with SNARE-associated domain
MGDSRTESFADVFLRAPAAGGDGLNLRLAFALYLAWMAVLTAAARLGFAGYEAGSTVGLVVWLLAGYVFYLSLCSTFVPAPTAWAVMLLASDFLAGLVGLSDAVVVRLLVVTTLGALGTAVANLNEYHLLTFLLRYRRAASLRRARFYKVAAGWFSRSPFWVLAAFSLVPIPVDVVRWLAAACGYSRWRYFWAYFLGRWVRYALLATSTVFLALEPWQIAAIQIGLVVLAAMRFLPGIVRRLRQWRRQAPLAASGDVLEPAGQTT